jgi:uncharacterized membrane protein
MRHKSSPLVTLLALGLFAVSCDKGTPVAPRGAVLSVSASPLEIGVGGTSTITVVAHRGNGVPVNRGTEIRLGTTLGSLPEIVTTDERGIARAVLQAGDRAGTARVTAASGAVEASPVEVRIGFRAATVVLQAVPGTVGRSGGTVALTATVLDEQGRALEGAVVNFRAGVGTFSANLVRTDAAGIARTNLTLTAGDIASLAGDSLEVTAQAAAGGASGTGTTLVRISRPPNASFTRTASGLQVIFNDTSTGNPTSWRWSFGDGASSSQQNPVHTYGAPGTYAVTLTVSNAEGSDTDTQFVSVSGGGS